MLPLEGAPSDGDKVVDRMLASRPDVFAASPMAAQDLRTALRSSKVLPEGWTPVEESALGIPGETFTTPLADGVKEMIDQLFAGTIVDVR